MWTMVGLAVAALVVLFVIAAVLAFFGNAVVQTVLIARERRTARRPDAAGPGGRVAR